MLLKNNLPRIFLFNDNGQTVRLSDPDSNLSPEAVLNFYANTYPILTNAKIEGGEIQDDELQYKFVSTIGTKG